MSLRNPIRYISKIVSYIPLFGVSTIIKKLMVDFCILIGLEQAIPRHIRWRWAHDFHLNWKRVQLRLLGTAYYRIMDKNSIYKLHNFYGVGTDFTGKIFVDVGSGVRGLPPVIQADEKIGIDPCIDEAEEFPLDPNSTYLHGKGEAIPLSDDYADIVSLTNVLNHVEDPEKVLSEVYRILKSGGLLLFETLIQPVNIGHLYTFTASELKDMVFSLFEGVNVKYERSSVDEDEGLCFEGSMPMRWGGVFRKRALLMSKVSKQERGDEETGVKGPIPDEYIK